MSLEKIRGVTASCENSLTKILKNEVSVLKEHGCIILSTACCHNFHWQCTSDDNIDNNPSSINGLKNWVIGHNRLCCPYCRSIMF